MRGKNTVEDWAEIDDILRAYPDGNDKDSLIARAGKFKKLSSLFTQKAIDCVGVGVSNFSGFYGAFKERSLKGKCVTGFIYLLQGFILENGRFNNFFSGSIVPDVEMVLPILLRESLFPYVSLGLEFQQNEIKNNRDGNFSVASRTFSRSEEAAHNIGNSSLSDNCGFVFSDVIKAVIELDETLNHQGVVSTTLRDACDGFSAEQLAFIYAQLSIFEQDEEEYKAVARDQIYQIFDGRSDGEKKKFMQTIGELGYCNPAEGCFAMFMSLADKYSVNEDIVENVIEPLVDVDVAVRNDYKHIELCQDLIRARRAAENRRIDVENGEKAKTVKQYMAAAYSVAHGNANYQYHK